MTANTRAFEWPIRVYYEDTDAQGVVYFANYFRFMERARTEWLRSLGVDQHELLVSDRRMFVVTKTELEFIVPARFNDELIATAELSELNRASFVIKQDIYRSGPENTLCCRGIARAAYLDADTLKPQRVPASFFEEGTS